MTGTKRAAVKREPATVTHVLYSLGIGGAEKLAFDMIAGLPRESYRPMVICIGNDGPLGDSFRQHGVPVFYHPNTPGQALRIVSWLKGVIESEGVSVIHAHQYNPLQYSVLACWDKPRVNLVYTEHGRMHPERFHWKRYLTNPIFARRIDHMVTISESTRRAMVRYDNFPARRIKVIHNGIDCARLNPEIDLAQLRRSLGIGPKTRVIGTASRLEAIKNIPMMLRGFRLLLERSPDSVLLIAGQGSESEKLRHLAAELGVAEKVRFLGLRSDLPVLFSLMEVFLLVSFTEGISVTLLEAMGSGVPPVVTRVGGNPEVVQDGINGCAVEVGDDAQLAQRVLEILDDPALAARLGEAARERVRGNFSFRSMMECYLSLYDRRR